MSLANIKLPELKDDFIIKQIKMISEFYDAEIFLNQKFFLLKIYKQNFLFYLIKNG